MEDHQASRLDKRIMSKWRIEHLGWVLIAAAIGIGTTYFLIQTKTPGYDSDVMFTVVVMNVILLVFLVIIVPPIMYRRWRYRVSANDIDIEKGAFIRKRTIIPVVQIQHVDTIQGPILRVLGLAQVRIATSAGSHTIPGLDMKEAEELRDRVADLARESHGNA